MGPVCDLSASGLLTIQQNPMSVTQGTRITMHNPAIADLHHTRQQIRSGQSSAEAELDRCISVAEAPASSHVFLQTMFDTARAAAADPANARRPLVGLTVSIKDLFDVAGQVTRAGSTVLAGAAPAARDCPAVARLRTAGAAIIGRTNMVEFAFSGVGINPHFGTPANAASLTEPLIPGGSSSGAAVSVALGSSFIGLGSDTGGSIRIPAALNGIVGFKSTACLVPTLGAIPLSTTLDTAGALTRSVDDAMLAHELLSGGRVLRSVAPLRAYRLAVVRNLLQDDLDITVARAFERSLAHLRSHHAQVVEVDLPELAQLSELHAHGGFSGAESLAWHRHLLAQHEAEYDPRVVARIRRGENLSAADYCDLVRLRQQWIVRMQDRLAPFDAVLSPTVQIVAPEIAAVAPGAQRDDAFFATNARLLRNTSLVNLLDGCAVSLPCHVAGELPVGLMVWNCAMRDDQVLNVARQIELLLPKD